MNKLPQTVIQRSQGLSLICILTFIGSGLSAFSFLIIFLIFHRIPGIEMDEKLLPQIQEMKAMIAQSGRIFFLFMFILYIVSLFGAVMMWKRIKNGFHFYTTSQLLMLLLPFFMIVGYAVPLSNIIITSVFIGAYGLNLKEMH